MFREMTAARFDAMRALALLKKRSTAFTEECSTAIAELCDGARVALDVVRDLAASGHTGLSEIPARDFMKSLAAITRAITASTSPARPSASRP
jgi:hypothetical protein